MNEYHILYTINNNYFRHFMVSLVSLLENNMRHRIFVHVISDELSIENQRILKSVELLYPNMKCELYSSDMILEYMKNYNIKPYRGSLIPVYRLFFSLILKDIDYLLYLDADTIVVDDLDLEDIYIDKTIMACIDHMPKSYIDSLDSDIKTYFNSGVLLINNKEFMNNGKFEDIVGTIRDNNKELKFFDQDILNITFNGDIGILPLNYNVLSLDYYFKNVHAAFRHEFGYQDFYSDEEVKYALGAPKVLHATDIYGVRPWDDNSIHPYNDVYRKYYKKVYDEELPMHANLAKSIKTKCSKVKMLCKYYLDMYK